MDIVLSKDLLSIIGLCILTAVHLLCGKQKWWQFFEAHGWVSFSAGASVAYVFIHVFPEISLLQQQHIGNPSLQHSNHFFNQPLYLMAMGGICLPYLLDTLELSYTEQKKKCHKQIHKSIYVIRKLLYVLYNMMVAYMIVNRHNESILSMKIIIIVLSLHFIVLNANFKEIYHDLFTNHIRWFAIIGLILGAILGKTIILPGFILAYVFSLIGGVITYIALKQELPKTNHHSPFHFLAGIVCFSLLILSIPYFSQTH